MGGEHKGLIDQMKIDLISWDAGTKNKFSDTFHLILHY